MPSFLGFEVKPADRNNEKGYIDADIALLKHLEYMDKNGKLTLPQEHSPADLKAFLDYLAEDREKYPLPNLLVVKLEKMLEVLEGAKQSYKTADATRNHLLEQIAIVEDILGKHRVAEGVNAPLLGAEGIGAEPVAAAATAASAASGLPAGLVGKNQYNAAISGKQAAEEANKLLAQELQKLKEQLAAAHGVAGNDDKIKKLEHKITKTKDNFEQLSEFLGFLNNYLNPQNGFNQGHVIHANLSKAKDALFEYISSFEHSDDKYNELIILYTLLANGIYCNESVNNFILECEKLEKNNKNIERDNLSVAYMSNLRENKSQIIKNALTYYNEANTFANIIFSNQQENMQSLLSVYKDPNLFGYSDNEANALLQKIKDYYDYVIAQNQEEGEGEEGEGEDAAAAAQESERQRLATEEAERQRLAAEEAAAAAQESERQRLAIEEAERQRLAAEEAAAAEESERQRLATEEAERQRLAAEEAAAAQESERQRLAIEESERQRLAAEEAAAAQESERQRLAIEESERQRLAAEEAAAAEESERQRLAAEEAAAAAQEAEAPVAAPVAAAAQEAEAPVAAPAPVPAAEEAAAEQYQEPKAKQPTDEQLFFSSRPTTPKTIKVYRDNMERRFKSIISELDSKPASLDNIDRKKQILDIKLNQIMEPENKELNKYHAIMKQNVINKFWSNAIIGSLVQAETAFNKEKTGDLITAVTTLQQKLNNIKKYIPNINFIHDVAASNIWRNASEFLNTLIKSKEYEYILPVISKNPNSIEQMYKIISSPLTNINNAKDQFPIPGYQYNMLINVIDSITKVENLLNAQATKPILSALSQIDMNKIKETDNFGYVLALKMVLENYLTDKLKDQLSLLGKNNIIQLLLEPFNTYLNSEKKKQKLSLLLGNRLQEKAIAVADKADVLYSTIVDKIPSEKGKSVSTKSSTIKSAESAYSISLESIKSDFTTRPFPVLGGSRKQTQHKNRTRRKPRAYRRKTYRR